MSDLLPAVPKVGTRVAAADVQSIERHVAEKVFDVSDIETAEEWRAQARALERYLRDKELQRPMLGAQRRVEGRIGQLLGDPSPGRRSDLQPLPHDGKVDRHEAEDFRLLGRALGGECAVDEDEWRKSRRALVKLVRWKLGELPDTPPLPADQFRCVVADPPWPQDTGPDMIGGTGESGHDALAYSTLGLEAIEEIDYDPEDPASTTALDCAADDSHLYLWTTNRHIEAAYRVARAWGFRPSVLLVWAKPPMGVGLGDTFRLTTEFILFARRGSLDDRQIIPTTWFDWKRSTHSVKPDAFYEMVESVTPGPYLDMFARKARSGWSVWGAEVGLGN